MASVKAQNKPQMRDLKDLVIAAHGGLDRWNQLSEARAHLLLGGVLWPMKKQDGVINDSMVQLPPHVATHCAEQVFYFNEDGLLRRHDYISDVVGWGPAVHSATHYTSEYREFDGIMVPTRRRVYPVDTEGNVAREPFLVTIDLDSIKFS